MSDRYGFNFDNDGKVSFTESHMTYHIERETVRNNSLYDSLQRNIRSKNAKSNTKGNAEKPKSGFGLVELILLLSGG